MDDLEIIQWAHGEDKVIITLDKDFGELAVAQGEPHSGIVRLPDVPVLQRQQLMKEVLQRRANDLKAGAVVTVTLSRIRVRRS